MQINKCSATRPTQQLTGRSGNFLTYIDMLNVSRANLTYYVCDCHLNNANIFSYRNYTHERSQPPSKMCQCIHFESNCHANTNI